MSIIYNIFNYIINALKNIEWRQVGGYTGGKRPEGNPIPPRGGSGNSKFYNTRHDSKGTQ
jgi:hypothetical protein